MRRILTILRRELGGYFTGPIAYIYLIVFLLFTNFVGLFLIRGKSFFEFPIADMREYLHVVAGVSTFLVAAITMRLWAEERKENTYEMLLTLPMKSWELVAGKFLASLSFYVIALLSTVPVAVMMIWISPGGDGEFGGAASFFGKLDPGATMSGYLGALLLGGLFIAFGLFISGLCRDQIVAFVITAPTLFIAYVSGTNKVKSDLNTALSFLGNDVGNSIGEFIGVFGHFDNLARGLVQGADILFFAIWIVVLLLLNVFALERRGRPNANLLYAASLVMLIGIGLAGNWILTGAILGRMDVTQEQKFTIAPISGDILKDLDDTIHVRYIVSPRDQLPTELQDLERDVRDKLDALAVASGGKLRYQVILRAASQDLADKEEKAEDPNDPEAALKKRLLKKIKPFSVEVAEGDRATAQLVYSGLELAYKEKETEVISPIMTTPSPRTASVSDLEYRIIKYIMQTTRKDAPVVALYAPMQEVPPQMAMMYRQMGRPVPPPQDPWEYLPFFLDREGVEVKRIRLSKAEPVPDEAKVLCVLEPTNLNERQLWEINRALVNGIPVVLAVQKHTFTYQMADEGWSVNRRPLQPGDINRILSVNGVSVTDALVMDKEHAAPIVQPVQTPLGRIPGQIPAFPMHVVLSGDALNGSHPIFNNIEQVRFAWGTTLHLNDKVLKEKGIESTVLLRSNSSSWTRTITATELGNADIAPPPTLPDKRSPLAAALQGQFAMAFDGPAPEWPPEKPNPMQPPPPEGGGEPGPVTPKPGALYLFANARMFQRDFIQWPEMNLFLNTVTHLGMTERGRKVRELKSKTMTNRAIGDIDRSTAAGWKFVQLGGIPLLIAAAGLIVWFYRYQRRQRYERSFR